MKCMTFLGCGHPSWPDISAVLLQACSQMNTIKAFEKVGRDCYTTGLCLLVMDSLLVDHAVQVTAQDCLLGLEYRNSNADDLQSHLV